jgi:NTP pyrophosphatase (non-canonical NTP hydrolase)
MPDNSISSDSYSAMLAMVKSFHEKHDFSGTGGEDMVYRIALMAEELGEMSCCVTKGKGMEEMAEETADLLILVLGTAIAGNFDLLQAFWNKMDKLMQRDARMIDGRIRVSEFRGQE